LDQRIAQVDAIFGQVIVSLRKERGMDQKSLAECIEINQPALSRLERGESAANIVTLLKLSDAFDIPTDKLMHKFEIAKERVQAENVQITSQKSTSGNVALALLGGAALAFLISRP